MRRALPPADIVAPQRRRAQSNLLSDLRFRTLICLCVTHAELGAGEFCYALELTHTHTRLGLLVHQFAWFRETTQWMPPSC